MRPFRRDESTTYLLKGWNMPDVELQGVVVAQDSPDPLPVKASPHDGLYLQTDDGRMLELIDNSMAAQMPVHVMWRQSRARFETYLGQRVTVQGYLVRRTVYSARVIEPLAGNSE
jgi:hypothetical protein